MDLMNLNEMRNYFQSRFVDFETLEKHDVYGTNDLLISYSDGENYIISLQHRPNFETTDSLRKKFDYSRKIGNFVIPVFLTGRGNKFIFPYEGNKKRIQNVDGYTENVFGVQEKVKLTSRLNKGSVVSFRRNDDGLVCLQIFQTKSAWAKSNHDEYNPPPVGNPISSDKKFKSMELERALHFSFPAPLKSLEELTLFGGNFYEIKNTQRKII